MDLLFALAYGLVLVVILVVGSFALNQRNSDAAGNGLAQVFLVFGLGVQWIALALLLLWSAMRDPHPSHVPDLPWSSLGLGVLVAFVLAAPSQIPAALLLGSARTSRVVRGLLYVSAFLVPLAFAAFIAWHAFAWPLPFPAATVALAVYVVAASALPWLLVWDQRRR